MQIHRPKNDKGERLIDHPHDLRKSELNPPKTEILNRNRIQRNQQKKSQIKKNKSTHQPTTFYEDRREKTEQKTQSPNTTLYQARPINQRKKTHKPQH